MVLHHNLCAIAIICSLVAFNVLLLVLFSYKLVFHNRILTRLYHTLVTVISFPPLCLPLFSLVPGERRRFLPSLASLGFRFFTIFFKGIYQTFHCRISIIETLSNHIIFLCGGYRMINNIHDLISEKGHTILSCCIRRK